MDKSEIAVITTVSNFELYNISSKSFPIGIRHYVIDGRNGMHSLSSIFYMFKKLRGKGIKWLIMADEDVIFTNPDKIFDLIRLMEKGGYTVCGVRDGGVISHRNQNPYLINTFFSTLNFRKVITTLKKRQILTHQYINENEFKDDLASLKYGYDPKSLYEPYYCFYLWLRRSGEKILFLPASMTEDNITNKVFNNDGELLLYHTWYARSYGRNEKHTKRINTILDNFDLKERSWDPEIFKDKSFTSRQIITRLLKKINMRLKRKRF